MKTVIEILICAAIGLAIALMFVLGLIALVNWVVATPLS